MLPRTDKSSPILVTLHGQFFSTQVILGSLLALIHAHKLCLTVDKEAIAQYDAKLKEERKRAEDQVPNPYVAS